MVLHELKINNFKNYQQASFDFSPKLNCFVGNNGVGKTNILDAIYYLSFCKSYFNAIDAQNIRHNEDFFAIHGNYDRVHSVDSVSCQFRRHQKKKFKRNQKEYSRLADHIGLFPLVMISPYDRDLINDGSELRRKFIDGVISQFDRTYLDNLLRYNKALAQRNYLLKQFAEHRFYDERQMELWDKQLIQYGKRLFESRQIFLETFTPVFADYFRFISDEHEQASVTYTSQMIDKPLETLLADAIDKDRAARYTTVGIHKDDLEFLLDGFPVKKFGSQGQQKSFVIALRLAQFDYMKELKQVKPILLFDDIFDKLDENRVSQLIQLVSRDHFGQVFITDTQPERIQRIFDAIEIDHKVFLVKDGQIKNETL